MKISLFGLKETRKKIGTILQLPSEEVAEILGYVGMDLIILDMEHCPSVINRMSAFSNASSFISRNASRIGGSKSVPPSKKCSAAESRSSDVY